MASTPTVKVEIAFEFDPLNTAPTWTDVSAYVRSGSISRGRSNETQTFSAGSASITLSNRDRRFDPMNTTGPYYAYMSPRNQVRITATWNAVTYPLFRGFVTGWPQTRDLSNRDASVEVTAVDGLGFLSGQIMERDIYTSYLTSLSPTAVWPLGDDGTTQTDIVGGQNFTTTSALAHTDTPCAPYLSGNPTSFTTLDYGIGPQVNTTGAFSIVAWFRTNSTVRAILEGTAGNRLILDGFGLPHYYTTGAATVYGNQNCANGASHMVVLTHDATSAVTAPTMWVDGLDKSAGATAAATGAQVWQVLAGGTPASGTGSWEGPMQQVAVVPSVLTGAQVYSLYYLGQTGYSGQSTASQIGFVLDCARWPTSWRSLTSNSWTTQAEIKTDNSNALDVIGKIVTGEVGQFYIDASGNAVLLGAWDLWDTVGHSRNAVSQATFADDGTAGAVRYSDTGFDLDDAYLANDVEVKTGAGESARARDTTSIARYGKRSLSLDTRLATISAAQTVANYRLSRYAYPTPRLRSFTVMPQRNASVAYPKVLGLDLQDRVTVKATPLNTGSALNAEFWIEAISHDFAPGVWTTTLSASQVPTGGWTLDTSAFDGRSTRLG